jgi:hypothetical protein
VLKISGGTIGTPLQMGRDLHPALPLCCMLKRRWWHHRHTAAGGEGLALMSATLLHVEPALAAPALAAPALAAPALAAPALWAAALQEREEGGDRSHRCRQDCGLLHCMKETKVETAHTAAGRTVGRGGYLCTPLGSFTRCGSVESVKAGALLRVL